MGEACSKSTFGFCFGLKGRIGKLLVNPRGDRVGLPGISGADNIPTDLAFAAGAGLIKIIITKIHAAGITAFFGSVEDAANFEVPLRSVSGLAPDGRS